MTVVLQEPYKDENQIVRINKELTEKYQAPLGVHFITQAHVKEETHYINTDPEGLKQLRHITRPLSADWLSANFCFFRIGQFHIKISAPGKEETLSAIAICKWITQTRCKFIAKNHSFNYTSKILRPYLNWKLREWGYDLNEIWALPSPEKK